MLNSDEVLALCDHMLAVGLEKGPTAVSGALYIIRGWKTSLSFSNGRD